MPRQPIQALLRSRWLFHVSALALFTLAAIPLAHRFWEVEGLVAVLEQALVHEHITVVGASSLLPFFWSFGAVRAEPFET